MSSQSRSPMPEPVVGQPALEAPFVGRTAELQVLVGALDDAFREGKPRFVLVDGAAGIGKSRLVREFLSVARERASAAAILQGRCLATGRATSYWALGEVLRRACAIGLDDRAEDAEQRLRDGLTRILAPLGLTEAETEETVQALATSAGHRDPWQSPRARRSADRPGGDHPGVGRFLTAHYAARRRDPRHRGSPLGRIRADLGAYRRSPRCSTVRSCSSGPPDRRSWVGSRPSCRTTIWSASRSRRCASTMPPAW